MSMNAQFRQVSPRALEILLGQPELIAAAVLWENAAPEDSAGPLAGLPANMRAIFGSLPPEAQKAAVAEHARMIEQMRTQPLFAMMQGEQDEDAGKLRAAGIVDDDLPEAVDIGQTWHGLHFLLAGSADDTGPGAAQAVLGGRETENDDFGYGPVRVMTPEETADVAAGLAALTEDEFAARHDADAMHAAEIYGAFDEVEWLLEAFRQLRDYYAAARERGYGMLLAIT
ncbi:MAG: YfbM family protein [Longimicrobiaceae bacterium]